MLRYRNRYHRIFVKSIIFFIIFKFFKILYMYLFLLFNTLIEFSPIQMLFHLDFDLGCSSLSAYVISDLNRDLSYKLLVYWMSTSIGTSSPYSTPKIIILYWIKIVRQVSLNGDTCWDTFFYTRWKYCLSEWSVCTSCYYHHCQFSLPVLFWLRLTWNMYFLKPSSIPE